MNEEVTEAKLEKLREAGIEQFKILFIDGLNVGSYLRDTLLAEKVKTTEDAIMEIYRRLRPGDPPTLETAKTLFHNLFFNPERYDLSKVGRLKLNYKFYRDLPEDQRPSLDTAVLTPQDILETVRHLIELKNGRGSVDDIDHLGNRRVRAVGELMENQYRIGLVRMERAIKERMSMSQEIDTLMPHDLINAKPVSAVVKEYFGSSQLSQFMDQTNPLSEVTHKRRLSRARPRRPHARARRVRGARRAPDALRPHLPDRDAGRSEHRPHRVAVDVRPRERVRLRRDAVPPRGRRRRSPTTCRGTRPSRKRGSTSRRPRPTSTRRASSSESLVSARLNGDFHMVTPDMIQLMDVAPNQMVSVAAALVPFLEHDDANRALMGANMQRQAVPLIRSHAPFVGTGMEGKLARDSGVCTLARRDGIIESVDATRIVVRPDSEKPEIPDIYPMMKFQRSNQSTCYNQTPIVRAGDRVKAGDVLADGPSTDMGELALGQNVLVAFMPWQGYNFEDSILVSERIAKDDVFTSIHIEEFECVARDTKLGKEEVTRDIPNVGEEALKDLDESGIVRIGAEVKPGDILVGKITPKGETQLSPEEKLLRAIFGEKAGDVRDSSLRVPPGVSGIVINARVFSRKGTEKDERSKEIEDHERVRFERMRDEEIKILRDSFYRQIKKQLVGHVDDGQAGRRQGQGPPPEGRRRSTRRRSRTSRASTGRSCPSRAPRRSRRRCASSRRSSRSARSTSATRSTA